MSSYDVVVPAFKVTRTIGATLESLLGQTVAPARIIVAEDGCPESSADVAEAYAGVEIMRFPHGGLTATHNRALEHVTAPYVAMVDSDDLWHPEAGRLLLDAIERTGAAAVSIDAERFVDGSAPAFDDPPEGATWSEVAYEALVRFNWLVKAGTLYRTEAVREAGGWREDLTITSDREIALRLMDHGGKIFRTAWRGLGFRVSPGGMSRNPERSLRDKLDLALPRLERLTDDQGELRRYARSVWFGTLARAADDRRDLRDVPPLTSLGVSTPRGQRALEALVRSPLRHAIAAGWRGWKTRRPQWAMPRR
jgi:glycosyltransferase involved in cell wall biosynthesis